MNLQWQQHRVPSDSVKADGINVNAENYTSSCAERSEKLIRSAVNECVEKAVSLLPINMRDNSRYLLFDWDLANSTLMIVVTDDAKKNDSPNCVSCQFAAYAEDIINLKSNLDESWQNKSVEHSDLMKYWIRDYLTTCGGFLQFALIAVFCNEDRTRTELL